MTSYLLAHRHTPAECGVVFAAWKGYDSPLRRQVTTCSCGTGGHQLWWTVQAHDADGALALLPPFLAARTEVVPVADVEIP